MSFEEEYRKRTLDQQIDNDFAEIFFMAKEEYDIENNSREEQKLYNLLTEFKFKLKKKCKEHFEVED